MSYHTVDTATVYMVGNGVLPYCSHSYSIGRENVLPYCGHHYSVDIDVSPYCGHSYSVGNDVLLYCGHSYSISRDIVLPYCQARAPTSNDGSIK